MKKEDGEKSNKGITALLLLLQEEEVMLILELQNGGIPGPAQHDQLVFPSCRLSVHLTEDINLLFLPLLKALGFSFVTT